MSVGVGGDQLFRILEYYKTQDPLTTMMIKNWCVSKLTTKKQIVLFATSGCSHTHLQVINYVKFYLKYIQSLTVTIVTD